MRFFRVLFVIFCFIVVVVVVVLFNQETKENHQEFGGPFYRGVFDGFWWAFVTMSTVG